MLATSPAISHAAPIWVETYGGATHQGDVPLVAVGDGDGGVTVTGESNTREHHRGITTLRYDAKGSVVWKHSETLHDSTDNDEGINSSVITKDAAGNVTVLGQRIDDTHATVATYTPTGVRTNRVEVILPGGGEKITGLQLYSNGDFSTTGTLDGIIEDDFGDTYLVTSLFVARYNHAGKRLWYDIYNGDPYDEIYYNTLAGASVDSAGNITLAGLLADSSGDEYAGVRKYDSKGKVLYTKYQDDPNVRVDSFPIFAVDSTGAIYLASLGEDYNVTSTFGRGFLLIKFTPDGDVAYTRYDYHAAGGYARDYPTAITVDKDDNVIVGGYDEPQGFEEQRLLIKWDSKGHEIWWRLGGDIVDVTYAPVGLFPVGNSNEFYCIDNRQEISQLHPGNDVSIVISRFGSNGMVHHTEAYARSYPNQVTVEGGAYDTATNSLFVLAEQPVTTPGSAYPNNDWATVKYSFGK